MSRKILTKHKINFRYAEQSIPAAIFTQGPMSDVQTILYLGTLHVGYLPKIIASHCPYGTAVVQGAPHWRADKSGETIPDFMWRFTQQTYEFIAKQRLGNSPINIIADSQAVPGPLRLSADNYDDIRAIVLLQPLGFNSESFGYDIMERCNELAKRTRRNFRYQASDSLRDTGITGTYLLLLAFMLRERMLGRLYNHYAAGLAFNSLHDLSLLVDKVSIVSGDKDQLFPYEEIRKTLVENHLGHVPLIKASGAAHSPLASKAGRNLLKIAFSALKTT